MLDIIILALAAFFGLTGLLLGIKRGFFPSVLRFAVVIGMAVLAFCASGPVVSWALQIKVTYQSTAMTVQEVIEAFLMQTQGISEILDVSATVQQLVFRLPEVILKEVVFVVLFFLLCFVSMPVSAILSAILFPKKRRGKRVSRFRLGGMLVGFVQGAFCFSLTMTLLLGTASFAARFNQVFAESDLDDVVTVTDTIDETFLSPLYENKLVSIMNRYGVSKLCESTFHELSRVQIAPMGDAREVYYFDTLEGMLAPISSLMNISGFHPGEMTAEEFAALAAAIEKAQESEEASAIVREALHTTVEAYVEEKYKDSATLITDCFVDNLLNIECVSEQVDLEKETAAIVQIMQVLGTVSSGDATNAFETVEVDAVVQTILDSGVVHQTLSQLASDEQAAATIRGDIALPDAAKEASAQALASYRDGQINDLSDEEYERLCSAIDAVAGILDLRLPIA